MLRDLALAGVMWELGDMVQVTGDQSRVPGPQSPVPPIAPTTAPDVSNINDIDTLIKEIENFNHPLKQFSKTITGLPPKALAKGGPLTVITDMPSNDDMENGQILTGTSGELFDKMIGAIGLSRESISILPLIFWRTPGGRTPTRDELDLARPFVNRAIELLQPKAILTLGTLAAAEICGAKLPTDHGTLRITNHELRITTIPIFHPNYLMIKPDAKRAAWDGLQKVLKIME